MNSITLSLFFCASIKPHLNTSHRISTFSYFAKLNLITYNYTYKKIKITWRTKKIFIFYENCLIAEFICTFNYMLSFYFNIGHHFIFMKFVKCFVLLNSAFSNSLLQALIPAEWPLNFIFDFFQDL